MLETIGTILGVAPFLLIGFFFLWIFVKINKESESRPSGAAWRELTANAQVERTARMNSLLWEIKTAPEWQKAEMWQEYLAMEADDKTMTRNERRFVISLETVIDDQTQYELDNGINPYRVAKPTSSAPVNAERARLGWK